jgi:hypothetical protein
VLCVGRGGIGERRTPGPYPDLMEDRIGLDTVWAIGSCAFMVIFFFSIWPARSYFDLRRLGYVREIIVPGCPCADSYDTGVSS